MEGNELNNINLKVSCPICYLPFEDKRKIVTLKCGHYFCDICLIKVEENSISNSNCEIKCSICRTVSNSFSLSNQKLLLKFNEFIEIKTRKNIYGITHNVNDKNTKNNFAKWNFCRNCEKLASYDKFTNDINFVKESKDGLCHNENHENFTLQEILNFIDEIKVENFNNVFCDEVMNKNLKNISSNLISQISICLFGDISLKRDEFSSTSEHKNIVKNIMKKYYLSKAQKILKLPGESEKDQRIKIKEIQKFKKEIKLLKNPIISQDITSNIFNHHTFFKEQKKFVAGFIENTKKVFTFDLSFLEISTYDILDFPINFNKRHNIEFDQTTEKFFFLSEETNFLKMNNFTKIWEFSVKTNKVQAVNFLNYLLIGHRSIIIADNLFIIGGREQKHSVNILDNYENYLCTGGIHIMDKLSYKIEKDIFKLSYPRANFGLAYENNNIYICFGENDAGQFLNSIEIIFLSNLSELKLSSSIVTFSDNENILRFRNIGVMVNCNKMIILGGETQNLESNPVIYHLDISDEFRVVETFKSKKIVSGYFTNYGIAFNSIYGFVSNHTEVSDIPHVYLFSESNNKWNCHGIDIY